MDELAVSVKDVSKTFHIPDADIQALKSVHFDTRVGEMQMIVGPSGSGKTTLLSVIAGTLNPDAGEIEVFGTKLNELSDAELTEFRKKNIGFIFQLFNLIPTLTAKENVSIPLILNGVHPVEAEKKAAEVLEAVGIGDKGNSMPNYLSGGEQQRLAIGRAIIHDPRLIICDEPTSALDYETGIKLMNLLTQIAKSPGRSVIVVTHDLRILKFADRIAKMDDGRVLEMHEQVNEKELTED